MRLFFHSAVCWIQTLIFPFLSRSLISAACNHAYLTCKRPRCNALIFNGGRGSRPDCHRLHRALCQHRSGRNFAIYKARAEREGRVFSSGATSWYIHTCRYIHTYIHAFITCTRHSVKQVLNLSRCVIGILCFESWMDNRKGICWVCFLLSLKLLRYPPCSYCGKDT